MSNLFMIFNNTIIKESNHLAFLICRKELVSFYKKFNWKKLNNKNISLQGHPFSTNGMIFKENNISKKKYYFNVNK